MIPEDFEQIDFFTQSEIEATGADIADVQLEMLKGVDHVRRNIGRRMVPLKNGITTGNHKSPQHPLGRAFDFYLDERDGPVTQETLYTLFRCAVDAGFRGFGFYFNGAVWSFHIDMREELTMWTGRKKAPKKGSWVYKPMSFGFQAH